MNRFVDLLIAEIPALRRYARALCRDFNQADDLVQECLARAIDRRWRWLGGRQMRPWLFSILHNLFIDGLRRQANSRRADGAEANREAIASDRDADLLCSLSDFEQALQRLPAEQREVLLLVGLEQMSYREVARVTGTPVGTVMSRLSRARDTLARVLDGEANPKPIKRVK